MNEQLRRTLEQLYADILRQEKGCFMKDKVTFVYSKIAKLKFNEKIADSGITTFDDLPHFMQDDIFLSDYKKWFKYMLKQKHKSMTFSIFPSTTNYKYVCKLERDICTEYYYITPNKNYIFFE